MKLVITFIFSDYFRVYEGTAVMLVVGHWHATLGVRWLCLHGLVQNPSSEKMRGYGKIWCRLVFLWKCMWIVSQNSLKNLCEACLSPLHSECLCSTAGFLHQCSSFVQKLYAGWTIGPRLQSLCPVLILRLCYQQYAQVRGEIFRSIYNWFVCAPY